MTDDLSFLMGSHGRDNFEGLINYEDVFRLDRYCITVAISPYPY